MAEQVFKSPGFFEREIDLSQRQREVTGVPAGVIGTAEMGPAFVPVTVGSFADFSSRFGSLDPDIAGPYAVNEFLKNRTACTYIRVLGAGANESTSDFTNTTLAGIVKNAGFILTGTQTNVSIDHHSSSKFNGEVQFIVARHYVSASTSQGWPIFADNDSFPNASSGGAHVMLVRGMLFTTTASQFQVIDPDKQYNYDSYNDRWHSTTASLGSTSGNPLYQKFKLVLSSSLNGDGTSPFNDDHSKGIKVFTASLDPSDDAYIAKVLNTDPKQFQREQHLLYGDFAVENEAATTWTERKGTVGILSGSSFTSQDSGLSTTQFNALFGRFDTRYKNAVTTKFISQPFSETEFDLFHFETLSDGANVSDKFKVSISNIRKSTDVTDPYGTFSVLVRVFNDTDGSPQILEQYHQCTLNPTDDDYVARKIGDYKVIFNFDAQSAAERRLIVSGKYPNNSSRVRIVMADAVELKEIPDTSLPFGFRGLPVLKTSNSLTDVLGEANKVLKDRAGNSLGGQGQRIASSITVTTGTFLTSSIMPPVPLTFKQTKGVVGSSGWLGHPGSNELSDGKVYWGVKVTRLPRTGTLDNAAFNANASSEVNGLVRTYTKMLGIKELDVTVTGSGADYFCNNKFTLARVATSMNVGSDLNLVSTINSRLTGTIQEHILETAYVRNGVPDTKNYTVSDGVLTRRVTFASLACLTSSAEFNKFSDYAKFTNIFYGGFDGVNILNTAMSQMQDRAASTDTGGMASLSHPAASTALDIGLSSANSFGTGKNNNVVASYRAAAEIMLDPMTTRINILAIPGIRDAYVTDFVIEKTEAYGQAIFLIDLASYDDDGNRLFLGDGKTPSVSKTTSLFEGRALNTNYAATYFPDVSMTDPTTSNPVLLPASIAAMSALGFSDSVSYPWFAPAGFNRASLDNVTNTSTRLTSGDRDTLYDARINPIATFPQAGFVIFGQKTLQQARSALDRVNVRRMLLEVKRLVSETAITILFEQNTPSTRARFIAQVTPQLALIQSQQGVDQFRVVMDDTNNSQEDVESNKLNGRIILVPTRAVEFISMDFIITNNGVDFA